MSFIGDIDASLAAMTTGVGRAQETAAAADNAAGLIAAGAVGSGFVGIAQSMVRVRDAIRAVQAQIAGLGAAVEEARVAVASAPERMSPQQAIAVLAAASEKIGAIHAGIGATLGRVDRVRQLTTAALQGGQPGPMLARLDAIRQVLIAVAERADTARQQVGTVLAQARKAGDGGDSTGGGGSDTSHPPTRPSMASPPPAPGFNTDPGRPMPGFVPAVAAGLEVPSGAKTAGVAVDAQGRPLHDGILVNGSRGAVVDNRPTLKPEWRHLDVALAHVEGHTAGLMRDRRLDHAVLIVTERPCKGSLGCHAMLGHLLDRDATVDVYVAREGGPVYWGTYIGTGEGVTQR